MEQDRSIIGQLETQNFGFFFFEKRKKNFHKKKKTNQVCVKTLSSSSFWPVFESLSREENCLEQTFWSLPKSKTTHKKKTKPAKKKRIKTWEVFFF
jgi:hypothetical protein